MVGSIPRHQPGVVSAVGLTLPPVGYIGGYFVFESPTPVDFLYIWIPVLLAAGATVLAVRWGRRVGFSAEEYGIVGRWATGMGAFVGVSVMVTVGVQIWKQGYVVDPWFIVANWTLTGLALGAVIGVYDGDRRVRGRQTEAALVRNARAVQQLSVLNRVLRHDVRTAVTVISGYAGLVTPDDDRERLAVERIQDRAAQLETIADNARILQDILTEDSVDAVDVGTYLQERVTELNDQHESLTATATVEGETVVTVPALFVSALDVALEVAVQNNTSIDPVLDVECTRGTHHGEDCVEISIVDNGPGIPAVERVGYESAEETPLLHASGIDLWLVKWAVEEADGEFAFEHGEDRNRMTIHLPAATATD